MVSNAGRIGPAGARNTGIRASQAEAIAFLDSDDTWEPRTLETFLNARRRDPQAVLIGSDYKMVDETSGSASTMKSFLFGTMLPWWENYPLAAAVIPLDLMRRDIHVITRPSILLSMTIAGFLSIQTSSAVVRRDAVFAAGLFNERLMRTEDIDLWLKLARLGRFVYLDEVLATYDISGRTNAARHSLSILPPISAAYRIYGGLVSPPQSHTNRKDEPLGCRSVPSVEGPPDCAPPPLRGHCPTGTEGTRPELISSSALPPRTNGSGC